MDAQSNNFDIKIAIPTITLPLTTCKTAILLGKINEELRTLPRYGHEMNVQFSKSGNSAIES